MLRPEAYATTVVLPSSSGPASPPSTLTPSNMDMVLPIDLVGLVATIMGISIVLIPVIGLTARFALKPVVEALARVFDSRGRDETVGILERRMALMEQQMESLEGSLRRLTEASAFHRELESGGGHTAPDRQVTAAAPGGDGPTP